MDITHAGLVKIKSWLQEVPSRNNQLQKKPKFMILKIMNGQKLRNYFKEDSIILHAHYKKGLFTYFVELT